MRNKINKAFTGCSTSTWKRLTALVVMTIITVSSVVTVMASGRRATIIYNGVPTQVDVWSEDTEDIIAAAGITLKSTDRVVSVPGTEIEIRINSLFKVAIDDGSGEEKTTSVYYGTSVATALAQAGVSIGLHDVVSPTANSIVTGDQEVIIQRNCAVKITADGKTEEKIVPAGTVAGALASAGVSVGADDIVSPALTDQVTEGMELKVGRVTYQEVTVTEDIAFQNTNENDSSLYIGQKKVKVAGKNGRQEVTKRQKLVDGEVVEETVLSTNVLEEPVSQITLVGTRQKSKWATIIANGTLKDHNGNTVSYKKLITGRCAAYTGGGTTATGLPAAVGRVAVNPNIIPYGTKLYICSPDGKIVYGYAVAADTGGGLMRGVIVCDLYMNTLQECRNFGGRNMNIYVLS